MKVRPASFSDYAVIKAVCTRHGMSLASEREWMRMWQAGPYSRAFAGLTPAWLLETDDGRAGGCLMSVPRTFHWNGELVVAAAASNWVVDPAYRAHSLKLAAGFFGQKGPDLLYNSTASPTAAKLMPFFTARPLPVRSVATSLFWATNPYRAARAAAKKRQWPAPSLIAGPLGLAATIASLFQARPQKRGQLPISRLTGFDVRFDDFWNRLSKRRGRLISSRDRQTLNLRFGPGVSAGHFVLVAAGTGSLAGYGLLRVWDDRANELRRGEVIDLQADPEDNEELLVALISELIREAKRKGCDLVEFRGFGGLKHRVAERLNPRPRPLAHMPFWYAPRKASLAEALQMPNAWDPSPYDYD